MLEIRSSALRHNLNLIHDLVGKPGVKVLIPVKANAYGCGLNAILPFLKEADIDMLGVANLREAQEIRRSGFKKNVLLLGSFYKKNVSVIFQENITPLITDLWQIEFLEKEAKARGVYLDIHVKWDLGMGRLGLLPDQEKLLLKHLSKTSSLKIKGMMTHFPGPGRKASLKQLARFKSLAERVIRAASLDREDVILHSANSYALLNYPESALDMIRPGLIFYGYFQNFKDYKKLGPKFPIRPSLRLTSKPFSQRILKKGAQVSYGSLYTVKEKSYPVAVLPIGYADGIPVALSNRLSFSGFPLLGRVTMDQIILGNVPSLGQTIELLGENSPPLEYWAKLAGTITYEIMTGFSERLHRALI